MKLAQFLTSSRSPAWAASTSSRCLVWMWSMFSCSFAENRSMGSTSSGIHSILGLLAGDAEAQLAQERGAGVLDHRVQLLLVKAKSIFGQRLLNVHEPAPVPGLNADQQLASSRLLRHRVHRPDRRLDCGFHHRTSTVI